MSDKMHSKHSVSAGRWKAYYKRKHIGNFSTKEEAIAARRAVVKALPEVL
jgi:hypothetical protein